MTCEALDMKDSDWKIIKTLHRNLNITKTANELYLTQPTLTKRLKSIEDELGVKLVERNTKGVTFTTQGEFLAEQSVKILEQIENTMRYVATMKSGESGLLKIGASNSFVRFSLPPILKNFHELYPKIEFYVHTDLSSEIVKKIKTKDLHIGFIRGDCPYDGERYLISKDQAFVAYNRPVAMSELPNIPQINYFKDGYSRRLIESWWREIFESSPAIAMEVSHGDACKSMVKNGLGYGIFLIDGFIDQEDGLVKTFLYWGNGEPLIRNTWMIYEKGVQKDPLAANFIDFIKNMICMRK
jgi:DNA-binding transcriptional LysR family regulator